MRRERKTISTLRSRLRASSKERQLRLSRKRELNRKYIEKETPGRRAVRLRKMKEYRRRKKLEGAF
jgi:hypothetical protein